MENAGSGKDLGFWLCPLAPWEPAAAKVIAKSRTLQLYATLYTKGSHPSPAALRSPATHTVEPEVEPRARARKVAAQMCADDMSRRVKILFCTPQTDIE